MLALESFVAFKPDFYCETSFNNKKYEYFLDLLTIIEKIRYLILDLLKAVAFKCPALDQSWRLGIPTVNILFPFKFSVKALQIFFFIIIYLEF